MATFPALPLFTDALTADCCHLSNEEFGLYVRLLILIWRSPDCRVPNDPEWVARKLSTPWDLINPLVKEFCSNDGNWVVQNRLSKEFLFVTKQRKSQSDRVKSRWNKEKESYRGNTTSRNTPTPTPTPKINPIVPFPSICLQAVEKFNAVARKHGLAVVEKLTARREKSLHARIGADLSVWDTALERLMASPFLLGGNDRGWRADFDFLLQEKSFTKLLEGGYGAKTNGGGYVPFSV